MGGEWHDSDAPPEWVVEAEKLRDEFCRNMDNYVAERLGLKRD